MLSLAIMHTNLNVRTQALPGIGNLPRKTAWPVCRVVIVSAGARLKVGGAESGHSCPQQYMNQMGSVLGTLLRTRMSAVRLPPTLITPVSSVVFKLTSALPWDKSD